MFGIHQNDRSSDIPHFTFSASHFTVWRRTESRAMGGTIDASETGIPLLCSKMTGGSPISAAQVSSFRSSSVAKVSATEFCSCSAPTMVTGVPFATRP
jgi:hypothetical protein